MYYVLHRPYGTAKAWLELPGFRSGKEARAAVKILAGRRTPEGERVCEVQLCVGKGRDRRTILAL